MTIVSELGSEVELRSLLGMHVLDVVGEAIGHEHGGCGDDAANARAFYIRLDGVIYRFAEDTNDGYRSGLANVITVEDMVSEVPLVPFPPMTVVVHWHPVPHNNDVIYFVNESTDLVVLEIGTTETDDYYPSFISHWVPEGHRPRWME